MGLLAAKLATLLLVFACGLASWVLYQSVERNQSEGGTMNTMGVDRS